MYEEWVFTLLFTYFFSNWSNLDAIFIVKSLMQLNHETVYALYFISNSNLLKNMVVAEIAQFRYP